MEKDCLLKMAETKPEKVVNGKFKRSVAKQFLFGVLANFSSIAPSMSLGFSAVAIPALKSASQNVHPFDEDQISWFASIASLATPFGCIFSGPISDRFGRRRAMMCVNVTCFVGWLIIASAYFAEDIRYPILLLGRLLTGLSTGLCSMPATIYMAEISSPKLRGVFTTWNSISFSLGVLIVYMLGYFLKDYWGTIALISAALPCIGMFFIIVFIPESPTWLVGKHRIEEAKTSMCNIFGTKHYIPEVEVEIETLIKNKGVKTDTRQKTILEQIAKKIKHLLKPTCIKPLVLIATFFFFQQFAGTFSIVFYAIDIVKAAGVTLDAYMAIVMIGLVRLITAIIASYTCKRFGKRPLSMISGAGMTVSMIGLGIYILLVNQGSIDKHSQNSMAFLPIVLLLFYFFTSTLGFLPLPFAMAAEVFPTRIRGTASGLTSGLGYFFNFITVKTYPNMISSMHEQGVFFFYGGVALVGTLFLALMLPETRGKTLQEIEELFGGKNNRSTRETELSPA